MDKEEQEHKRFLEQQLQWCKEQDRILEEIETKLYEMKKIAQYALAQELTPLESEQLNDRLKELEREVHLLEKQLHSVVH
jgi:predicted nuclease with TOPRIM domain